MASFDARIEKACEDGIIPGAVLCASSADGKFRYEKAFGTRSLKDPSPMKTDATLWFASCTKFMTTIAAMQCVERGLFKLDEDVTQLLPELKGREILKGFEEGTDKPIFVPNTKIITLRHLLTHQSGLSYDVFNPMLRKYQTSIGNEPVFGGKRSIADAYSFPLVFEPGESWEYSAGLDWAGEMVIRANNVSSLEEYMKVNIWGPLGIKYLSFYPEKNPEIQSRRIDMSVRDCGLNEAGRAADDDAKLIYTTATVWDPDTVFCHGGGSAYGAPIDYQKMLHSLCADDGKLLKPETVDLMFQPQLTDKAKAKMNELNQNTDANVILGMIPSKLKVDWGLGGIINLESYPGRNAGAMSWGGLPNLLWWLDRKAGLSGIFGGQFIPAGDTRAAELFQAWREEIYEQAGIKLE